ncbi:hypothetical protein WJX73_004397 [Symbiochloris irregularis]|uniref:TLC domain-containing protein n=1 Tax=Symbiochloris irregularis TaxID=706552 RepID=A0AAW1P9L7_9CHLO
MELDFLHQPDSILSSPIAHVLIAGLCFGCCEVFLTQGPPRAWLKKLFKPNERLKSRVDQTVQAANARIIGALHVMVQVPLAIIVMLSPEMRKNRIYSTSAYSSLMTSISAGYFLFDAFICMVHFEGLPYLLHGVFCFCAYTYAATSGFLHYYAAMFLMWEVSTPCVYVRWLLYHIDMHHTKLYVINGMLMLATFFCCRNILGTVMSINFFKDSNVELSHQQRPGDMPHAVIRGYLVVNVIMNGLNAMWFYKMAKGAVKVLARGPEGSNSQKREVTDYEERNNG